MINIFRRKFVAAIRQNCLHWSKLLLKIINKQMEHTHSAITLMKFYNNLSRRLHKGVGNIMSHLVALTEKKSEKLHSPDIDCISYESTKLNSCIRQAFDMTDACYSIFMTPFINLPGICMLSLFKIALVAEIFFLFRFVNHAIKQFYQYFRLSALKRRSSQFAIEAHQINFTLSNNLTTILVWGFFIIFTIVLLDVPKSGISIVTAGLATGVGFAMLHSELIPCTQCKYCMPCPYGLNIPEVFAHYNRCVNDKMLPKSSTDPNYEKARKEFLYGYDRSVPKLRQASHCIDCKQCEPKCPQGINISDEMHRIDKLTENLKQNLPFDSAKDEEAAKNEHH